MWLCLLFAGCVDAFLFANPPRECRVRTRATLDESAEFVRRELAAKQEAYETSRRAAARASADGEEIPSLEDLELVPFIVDGSVSDCGASKSTRASVYAVYDKEEKLVHVGKSRDAQHSLRTILARQPDLSYYFKVHHATKPSRSFLDLVTEAWASPEVEGNDGGEGQKAWEAPMDVKPLMTEEDKADFAKAKERGKPDMALKKVARRFEAEKVAKLKERGLTAEEFKFDPKLKGDGLLDIKHASSKGPDTSVPSTTK